MLPELRVSWVSHFPVFIFLHTTRYIHLSRFIKLNLMTEMIQGYGWERWETLGTTGES